MEEVSGQGALQHAAQTEPAGAQQQQQQQQQAEQWQDLLKRKDVQIEVLNKKLDHFRSWLSSLQGQMQHKDPQVIKNARRLYIGGIPEGAREVRPLEAPAHSTAADTASITQF